jgi:hypothetical protein
MMQAAVNKKTKKNKSQLSVAPRAVPPPMAGSAGLGMRPSTLDIDD